MIQKRSHDLMHDVMGCVIVDVVHTCNDSIYWCITVSSDKLGGPVTLVLPYYNMCTVYSYLFSQLLE